MLNLCKVSLQCNWILRGILSAPQGTTCSLLVSCKSLPWFLLLIFSLSSIGRLWVCICLECFLCLDPFLSIRSFLWSSSQVLVLLVSICSFLSVVNGDEFLEPWTMYSIMARRFPVRYFLVSFWINKYVFPLSGFLRSLLILFVILFIHLAFSLFFFFFLVAILSKIVRFLLHLVVDMFSCHLLPVVDKIFFRCFGMSCFVCIVLHFVDISSIFPSFASTFWFISSSCTVIFPVLPFLFCSKIFQRLSFVLWRFICVSSRISHPGYDFFFVLFEGIPIFSLFRPWID